MSETIYELIEDLITAAQREGESWEWGENMNARKREAQKAKDKLRDEIAKYSASIAAKDAEIERLRGAFIELIHRVNVWGSKTAGQSLPVELSDAIFQADLAVTQKQEGGAQ